MPPLRSLILALVPLLLGLIAHARGLTVSDKTSADIANVTGLVLDVAAILLFWVLKIHHDGLNSLYALMQAHMDDPQGHTENAALHSVPGLGSPVVTSVRSVSLAGYVKDAGTREANTAVINKDAADAGIMAKATTGVVLVVLSCGALFAGGCTNGAIANPIATLSSTTASPADKLTAAGTIYNSTMIALTLARQDGGINDTNWHTIRVASDAFNAAMDSLQTQVTAGVPLNGNSLWTAANNALQTLITQKGSASNVSTQPSSRNNLGPLPNLRGDRAEQWATYRRPAASNYRPTTPVSRLSGQPG